MNASVYLIHDKKRQKLDGTYPVKIRVIFQRKAKDYSLSISLTEKDFESAMSERPGKELKEVNMKLKIAIGRANDIVKQTGFFTQFKFQEQFYDKQRVINTVHLSNLFENYIQKLEKQERVGSAISYKTTKNSIISFKKGLTLLDISPSLLAKYEDALLSEGKSVTTVGIYMRQLRAIYNDAIAQNIISREHYPFGKNKYVIPASRNIKKALSAEELEKLYNFVPSILEEEKAHAFWIFSYLSNGMNFCDISKLKWKNVSQDFIYYIRSKTKNTRKSNQIPIKVPLHPQAKAIIRKWGKYKGDDSYIFPILTEDLSPIQQKYRIQGFIKFTNTHMETIRQHLKISLPCNTYSCRHSFATLLKRKNVSTEFISESLGHASILTTTSYLASFEDKTKIEYSNLLTEFN